MTPAHPIIEDLLWRHTVKKYDPNRRISDVDRAVIFESLRLSASSINSQPWRFIVLESEAARQRMYDTFVDKFKNNQPHVFDSAMLILFAHHPAYSREDYAAVVDQHIADGRLAATEREKGFRSFVFAEMNTDDKGYNGCWTRAQLYLALGNVLHTLARLRIGSTPLEGIDTQRVNQAFARELQGYRCDVALAIGYSDPQHDYNAGLPKSRLPLERVLLTL